MVNFDTRVFSEEGGQVIGAEVTVYSDEGDKIGNIAITDAESIEDLERRLAVIDETYFTEARLRAILENSSETEDINATSLSGFLSSDFAKVSQLSNYAPVSHNHQKSQITDLYNYQITANKYNVDIDSTVTITVKVTNQLGQPVVGVSVPVLKDNSNWRSGTTGVNGTFSLSYTADTWGLITFSANNTNTQIKVDGWRAYTNHSYSNMYLVYYNQYYTYLRVQIPENANVNDSFNGWHNVLNDTWIRPKQDTHVSPDNSGEVFIKAYDSARIDFKSVKGTSYTNRSIHGTLFFARNI